MLHKKSEKGQALILIALAIVGLVGLTALAVDGGVAYSDRRQAQNAADAAALAAAREMARGGSTTSITDVALSLAAMNGYSGGKAFVSVNSPPSNFIDSNGDGNNDCNEINDGDGYDGGDDTELDGGDNDDDNDGIKNSEDNDDDNDGIDDEHDNDDDNDGIDDEHDNHDNDDDNDGIENDDDNDDDNDGIDDEHDNDDDNDGIDDEHDNDDDNDGNEEPTPEQCHNALYGSDPSYIQVIITSYVDTYFAPVVGVNRTVNVVQAIARVIPPTPQVMYNGDAVVGLAPTGCDNVNIAGNGQIQTWGGGLFSNSTDNCGMTFQGSSQTQTHEGSGGINMVGGAYQKIGNPSIQDHGEGFHYNLPQYPYPPTDLPNPICTGDSSWTGNVMSPGNYTGTFPPAGVTTLQPGVYCIYGDFNMNGNDYLTGHEVVLVMETGALHWNGNAVVTDLTAPTSGPFQGLLMFAPLSNTNTMIFNGTADVSLSGTTLFPAAEIKINGAHVQFQKKSSQLIGYRVEISGGSDIQIEINHSSLYQPDTDPIIQLVQ